MLWSNLSSLVKFLLEETELHCSTLVTTVWLALEILLVKPLTQLHDYIFNLWIIIPLYFSNHAVSIILLYEELRSAATPFTLDLLLNQISLLKLRLLISTVSPTFVFKTSLALFLPNHSWSHHIAHTNLSSKWSMLTHRLVASKTGHVSTKTSQQLFSKFQFKTLFGIGTFGISVLGIF